MPSLSPTYYLFHHPHPQQCYYYYQCVVGGTIVYTRLLSSPYFRYSLLIQSTHSFIKICHSTFFLPKKRNGLSCKKLFSTHILMFSYLSFFTAKYSSWSKQRFLTDGRWARTARPTRLTESPIGSSSGGRFSIHLPFPGSYDPPHVLCIFTWTQSVWFPFGSCICNALFPWRWAALTLAGLCRSS